jgi:HEAT repeat protein
MKDDQPTREILANLLVEPGRFLDAFDPANRRIAVAASLRHPELFDRLAAMLFEDPEKAVRRECAEVLGLSGVADPNLLQRALDDEASEVREAAATALGEVAAPTSVDVLLHHATDNDEDKLVREAAVAALGAIGDERAVPVLLDLIENGPPQIRRRCVAALSVFDGEEIEAALRQAAADRNPMVREAAEMVVGRTAD